MKKIILIHTILALFCFSVKSQSEYQPGFIIKNSGDTLNGLVFYGGNGKFEKACLFKRFEIAQEFSYTPSMIKAYGFKNGRYFESKKTGRNNSFFECLVKGNVSVYINPGKYKGKVYLETEQTGFFELAKGMNTIEGAGNFSDFKETLVWILNQSGNKEVSGKNLDYDSGEIAAMVRESSSLAQNASKGFYQTPRVHNFRDNSLLKQGTLWSMGISGGYQFVSVTTPGNNYTQFMREADFNMSYRPAIGLYFNRKFSRKSNVLSIDLGLHYVTDTYYAYSEYSDGIETFQDDILIDFSEIQVPLALHLTLGKGSIHPYLKAGGFMSFLLDQSYSRLSEQQRGESVYTEYYTDLTMDGSIGFVTAAGIQFELGKARSLSLEGGYSKGTQNLSKPNSREGSQLKTSIISIMARINF
jgi:hypothetical protein